MTDMDMLSEEQPVPRRGLGVGSIMLLVGVALTAIVFGVQLLRQNQVQPTSGAAPDFALTTYDGEEFRLSEQHGNIVVVNFWASWCIPCRAEAPALQSIWEGYQDQGVIVLGVNWTETSDATAQAFMQEFGMTYPNGLDRGTRIADAYHITGVPETFVIDQEGNVAQYFYAEITEADLSALLDRLLNT